MLFKYWSTPYTSLATHSMIPLTPSAFTPSPSPSITSHSSRNTPTKETKGHISVCRLTRVQTAVCLLEPQREDKCERFLKQTAFLGRGHLAAA